MILGRQPVICGLRWGDAGGSSSAVLVDVDGVFSGVQPAILVHRARCRHDVDDWNHGSRLLDRVSSGAPMGTTEGMPAPDAPIVGTFRIRALAKRVEVAAR